MSQEFLESLSTLQKQKNIPFPELQGEIHNLICMGRTQLRLRIFVRFLSMVESLCALPESDSIRTLTNRALDTLLALIENRLNNKEGANNIKVISIEAHEQLQTLFYKGILCSPTYLGRFSWDLQKDAEDLRFYMQQGDTTKAVFLIRMIKDDFSFAGMISSAKITESAAYLQEEATHGGLSPKNMESLNIFINFIKESGDFLSINKENNDALVLYEEQITMNAESLIQNMKKPYRDSGGITLTSEEVNALLDEETTHSTAFTSLPERPSAQHVQANPVSSEDLKSHSETQDRLIKLAGKLFLKQELLKTLVPKDQKIIAGNKLENLEEIAKKLKEELFKNYYTSIKQLMSKEIREFVQQEVDRLGKNVKLAVRGENSEILLREGAFVKKLTTELISNSLSYSLESPARRQALEKTENSLLVVEFEDMGGEFQISVRDDGRGFNGSTMNLDELRSQLETCGGSLDIHSIEGESLKVCARFPMKKLITKSIICRCGSSYFLIPFRSIQKIVAADSTENPAICKDIDCIGQISLSAVLGIERSPGKIALICGVGEQKIVYLVEEVLGEIEALTEDSEVPLPPCCDGAVILSEDRIGFLINERLLLHKSQELIKKRTPTLPVLH